MQAALKKPSAVGVSELCHAGLRKSAWVSVTIAFLVLLLAHLSCASPRPAVKHEAVPEGRTLAVSVISKRAGKPVSGAQVKRALYGKDISPREREKKLTTDVKGLCAVPIPEPVPEYVTISIDAEGYVPVSASWDNTERARTQEPIPESFVFPLEEGTSIGGVVKNEEGEPVEGAKVYLSLSAGEGKIRYYIRDRYWTTNAEGKWRSDILPDKLDGLLMNVKHPDYVSTDQWHSAESQLMKQLRDFTAVTVVKKGVTVSGVVRDDRGDAMQGALVQTVSGGMPGRDTRTDQEGRFELKNCERGSLHIIVQARGKSPELLHVFTDEVSEPLEFRLERGNSIRIRVVDAKGNPIEAVSVVPETYKGCRYTLKMNLASSQPGVNTDKDGLIAWDSAPRDEVQYAFYKEGYARLSEVRLIADGKEHTVTLPRPIRVSGTVTDKATGKPIEKFRVVPVLGWLTGTTPTIERYGAFEATGGKYGWKTERTDTGHYLRIEAEEYLPAMSEMFRIGGAEEKTIDFKLEKGKNIEGVVRGIDGKPLEGADVLLCTTMMYLPLWNGRVRQMEGTYSIKSGSDGRFSFAPETEQYLLVTLHDSGYGQATREELTASGEIRMQSWGRIEGKLVRDGKPVASYKVRMDPIDVYNSDKPRLSSEYFTSTDENGAFVFDRVCPGLVSLGPELGPWEEYKLTSAEVVPLVIQPGETVKLSLGAGGRPVVGKVVLHSGVERKMRWDFGTNYLVALRDGIPVPEEIRQLGFDWRQGWNETWEASREGRAYFSTLHRYVVKLNPDGTFRIEGVPEGKYQLILRIYDPPQGFG